MTPFIKFNVPGRPVPKGRPRVTRYGNTYTPKKTRVFEKVVREEAALAMFGKDMLPADVGIGAFIDLYFPMPSSWSKKRQRETMETPLPCLNRVDVENVSKGILDALNHLVYPDDSQIICLCVRKYWCWKGDERSYVEIHAK